MKDNLDRRAVAPPLVMFEVYRGEVFKTGAADFDAVDRALRWLTVVDETDAPRSGTELQTELRDRGTPLGARDAFIARVAKRLDERLAVADSDFEADGLTEVLAVDFV